MTVPMKTPNQLPAVETAFSQVAPGGVASRTLLKAAGGAVTAFAFGADGGLAEHATPREALVIVTEGTLEVTLGGETRTVRTGESVHFPAGAPHAVHAPDGARMVLVLLQP